MNEKVCCILDKDENYATKLTEYINDRHLLPYQVMAFTSADALHKCCEKHSIEMLIVSEDINLESLENSKIKKVVTLSGSQYTEKEECTVYRYQQADQVVKNVLCFMEGYSYKYNTQKAKCCLSAVYSPATKCCKTTLSLGLALWAGKTGRSLYINFEQFAGLNMILPDNAKGLSEALYMYKTGGSNSLSKIIACTSQTHGFDYLYPATCAEDISEVDSAELMGFVRLIAESGLYQNIIIDVGNIFNKPWDLMDICSQVIIPEPQDYMGKSKLAEMEKYLLATGRSGDIDNIIKVNIPVEENQAGYEISYGYLESSSMKRLAGGILNRN